jgi:hypothetical protein
MVETDFEGKTFARHGLHMNHLDKEKNSIKDSQRNYKTFSKTRRNNQLVLEDSM